MATDFRLCSVNQRYNLKAIHNAEQFSIQFGLVVLSKSKIQSKSNSQRIHESYIKHKVVLSKSKIQSKSNSQRKAAKTPKSKSCAQ